ncbi:MAG: GNAT family N-acetyltransferase [Nocardioides sp.]
MAGLRIERDDPLRADVRALLAEHLTQLRALSPPESVHALDAVALTGPALSFWTAREGGRLLGCGALARLTDDHAEIKSMRTTAAAHGRGVATALLSRLLAECRLHGVRRVSLETGAQPFFAPAHRLYARHGFVECGPFGGYRPDPHSVFMTLALAPPTTEVP